MRFDHVAINVKNIEASTQWYVDNLSGQILYQDDTWALLKCFDCKIALTLKKQHPPHICFEINEEIRHEKFKDKNFRQHRDGSSSCYVRDLDGNIIEYLLWKN